MASIIYETFVIRAFEDGKLVGYVSSATHEPLWVVKHNDDGLLYSSYGEAEEAMHMIARVNPEYTFDVEVVFLDTDDMQALCN